MIGLSVLPLAVRATGSELDSVMDLGNHTGLTVQENLCRDSYVWGEEDVQVNEETTMCMIYSV